MTFFRIRSPRWLTAFTAVAAVALTGASSASAWTGGLAGVQGKLGANGWYISDVSVSYMFSAPGTFGDNEYQFLGPMTCTATDAGSGTLVSSTTFGTTGSLYTQLSGSVDLTTDGVFNTACSGIGSQKLEISPYGCGSFDADPCYSTGTFKFGDNYGPIKIDTTPPINLTVNKPAPNKYGWYNSPFTITISGSDPTSGIQSCGWGSPYGSGTASTTLTVNSNTPASGATGGCTNGAGLTAITSTSWRYDSTPPTVTVTGVQDGKVYSAGAVPAAACDTSDTLSGVLTNATLSLSGGPLGSVTATCGGAEDYAGNTNSAQVTYWVDTSLSGYPTLKSGAYNLSNDNLSGAYLDYLDLTGADAQNAKLTNASLIDTNLTDANLSQADLSNADLTSANLTDANLKGANLTGATGLGTATLTGVIWGQTTCPDGTVSNKDGGTCLNNLTP